MRRSAIATGAVLATALSALIAFGPIWLQLSKIGWDIYDTMARVFWANVLPPFLIGLIFCLAAILLSEHRPKSAVASLVAAPIAVVAGVMLSLEVFP